jgi:hypothetical protein
MNSRGQFDLIEIIITLIGIAMIIMIVLLVNNKVTDIYNKQVDINSTAYKAINKANTTFQEGLDKLFLGIFILLLLGMIILAFYIQSSVLFLIIFLIISVISTWLAAIISNMYMTVEATGLFATVLLYLPMQSFIMEHLPIFIAGFAMVLLIVTYSKDILFGRVGVEPGR